MQAKTVRNAVLIGMVSTGFLLILKLGAGVISGSRALLYDGFESLTDLLVLIFVAGALKLSEKPADAEHHFGHTKAESIAALFIGIGIFLFGIFLTYRSYLDIIGGRTVVPHQLSFLIAVLVVISKEILYFYTKRVARQTSSPSLTAMATDHHKDALTSIITVAGTMSAFFHEPKLDIGAGMITSLIIIYLGSTTIFQGAMSLMDTAPPEETLKSILKALNKVDGIREVSQIRARESGRYIYVDVKIKVDPELTVKKGHDIAVKAREAVMDACLRVRDVVVHVDPYV